MSDYKKLIDLLVVDERIMDVFGYREIADIFKKTADAIETLLAERDELLNALQRNCSCSECAHRGKKLWQYPCHECYHSSNAKYWQWRGIGGSDGT